MASRIIRYGAVPPYLRYSNRALASGFGLEPDILEGMVFPSSGEYARSLIKGLKSIEPLVVAKVGDVANDLFTPPMRTFAAGIIASVRTGAGGLPLGELAGLASSVAALAQATNPVAIAGAVASLLNVAVDIAVAGLKAAGAASEVIQVVPVIGTFIGLVADFIIEILGAAEKAKAAGAECSRWVSQIASERCNQYTSDGVVRSTSAAGVTPADMFRPVAYAWQKGDSILPLTSASMYVALCGRETQGFVPLSLATYMDNIVKERKVPGFDQQTKRRMWALIKGIMGAVKEPGLGKEGVATAQTDQGRSCFPMLQDIVVRQFRRGVWGDEKTDMAQLLKNMSGGIASQDAYQFSAHCNGEGHRYGLPVPDFEGGIGSGAHAAVQGYASCEGVGVSLKSSFIVGLDQYSNYLTEYFTDPVTGDWVITPNVPPKLGLVTARLTMSASVSDELAAGVDAANAAASGKVPAASFMELRIWQQALIAAGVAGAGYLGHSLVREFGPKGARR